VRLLDIVQVGELGRLQSSRMEKAPTIGPILGAFGPLAAIAGSRSGSQIWNRAREQWGSSAGV